MFCVFILARSLIECIVQCSYYLCECAAGIFSSLLFKCKLLDKKYEQLHSGKTQELIYFERNNSNFGT